MSEVNDLFRHWAKVTEQLTQAATILGTTLDARSAATVRSFRDHLSRNEFEAAWDKLAEAGTFSTTSPGFWDRLAAAARLLEQDGRRVKAEEHAARLRR
ncbi:MAG: hypothetical protein M3Y59_04510 [Myxococcota bacterium]|nr:hypothetical protein [Myxococcota bacterium]